MKHINPETLIKNSAYSQIITTNTNGKNIYFAGQTATNNQSQIIGKDDIKTQAAQVMKNIEAVLKASDADLNCLVKLTVYIKQGQDAMQAFNNIHKTLSQADNPPIITLVYVAGLIYPDLLIEIDGMAFISD